MAGVSSVNSSGARMVKNLIPTQKVGTEFLASSHFTIAQDESSGDTVPKSIFKRDYVPWEITTKPASAKPPKPAEILQKDDRYFSQVASETKQAFEPHALVRTEMKGARHTHGATNFKMDSDQRLTSFQTTHKRDYTPKVGENASQRQGKANPMQSFIPQGDPDKAPEPISDYRDRYRAHEAVKPEKVQTHLQVAQPTIKGDDRQHQFSTTHADTYKGSHLPKIPPYPAPQGTNIPQGDKEKEVHLVTTHQVSFPKHEIDKSGYDKSEVMNKLQGTNFRQDDGHGTWNDYTSTMVDSYKPIKGPVERLGPVCSRNTSAIPPGDENPWHNAQRASMTTNKFYFGNPAPVVKPKIESGADKRTKSQVVFGEPQLADAYYETTTHSVFKPVSVPYTYTRNNLNTKSVVPLDYYDDLNNTTYKTDFNDPKKEKMVPNPEAINKLKGSHIKAPLGEQRWFSTEHLDQYTPKKITLAPIPDPGKLQRSSVPIGTLNG